MPSSKKIGERSPKANASSVRKRSRRSHLNQLEEGELGPHTTKLVNNSNQPLSSSAVLQMQQTMGNSRVQRLLSSDRDLAPVGEMDNRLPMPSDIPVQRQEGGESFDIRYSVPFVPQSTNMSCWAASAAMLISWRDNMSIDDRAIAGGINYWQQYMNNGPGLDPEDVHMFRHWGLREEEPQSFTVQAFRRLIESYGPLWVAADANSAAGVAPHIRVVTGIYGDGSVNGTFLLIHDPAGTKDHVESYATYVDAQEQLASSELPRYIRPLYVAHL